LYAAPAVDFSLVRNRTFSYPVRLMSQPLDQVEESSLEEPTPPAAPITSRFLFVDVAAQRAKQLRRGALPRVDRTLTTAPAPHKLERVAMEEVRTGLIHYSLPTVYEGAGHSYKA